MSRYSGYTGRNVYYCELWYPCLLPAQRAVIDAISSATALLIPYVPVAILDPLMSLAGWDEGTIEGDVWFGVMGLQKIEVVIGDTTIEAYTYNFAFFVYVVQYQLDSESNLFECVQRQYPVSSIPFRWRGNIMVKPIF